MEPKSSNIERQWGDYLNVSFEKRVLFIGSLLWLGLLGYIWWLTTAPSDFPINTPVTIEAGMSASEIANELAEQQIVRSSDMLYMAIILLHDPLEVKAGSYVFQRSQNVFAIAKQITDDNPPIEHVTLTFLEGTTVAHYAYVARHQLNEFDTERFLQEAQPLEGFLFPETYYVPYTFKADQLIALLRKTYKEEVKTLLSQNPSTLTEYKVITLASLLEREANSKESMAMVAGILLNRLELNMPLQVDASMEYVIDGPLDTLTPADLQIDSPYNTYLYKGLPPTPIGNPGLDAISAVLHPEKSDFLYYITGLDGNFYYARTYEEHLENIETYLR